MTLIVADDHPAVTESVRLMLERSGYKVLAVAGDGIDALDKITTLRPAVAVIDLKLPKMHGLEVLKRVRLQSPETLTIIYSAFGDPAQLAEALDAGCAGFLLKDSPLDDLARAIPIVRSGEVYIDPVLGGAWMRGCVQYAEQLTKREREILRLLADGLTNEEIGKQLYVSSETVRAHVRKAMSKMGTKTRVQLVATALRQSLIA